MCERDGVEARTRERELGDRERARGGERLRGVGSHHGGPPCDMMDPVGGAVAARACVLLSSRVGYSGTFLGMVLRTRYESPE